MYDFFLQTSLFASLGVIIYLLARAVPRVNESGEMVHTHGRMDRILAKLPLEKIDARLRVIFEKTLRKTRIVTMKIDNAVHNRLTKLKKTENGVPTRGDLPAGPLRQNLSEASRRDLFGKREDGIKE